jgi:hypothetical protein
MKEEREKLGTSYNQSTDRIIPYGGKDLRQDKRHTKDVEDMEDSSPLTSHQIVTRQISIGQPHKPTEEIKLN